MGRHISQTKAINTGTYLWYPAELAVMREVGNSVAAAAFAKHSLPPKPSKDASPAEKMAYSTAKYAHTTPDYSKAATISHTGSASGRAVAITASSTPPRPPLSKQTAAGLPNATAPHVRATSLVGAMRVPEEQQPPRSETLIDLIDLETAVDPPPVEPSARGGIDSDILELSASPALNVDAAMHQKKKADILAHFKLPPMQYRPSQWVAPMRPNQHNDAFFAEFGL